MLIMENMLEPTAAAAFHKQSQCTYVRTEGLGCTRECTMESQLQTNITSSLINYCR